MLSYRHLFHAGNHGDVLKHLVLVQVLGYMMRKPAPLVYIDTHAGAGWYDLHADWAQKNREYETGVARLWDCDDLPTPLAGYMALVKQLNAGHELSRYPGSAWFALQLLRRDDRLRLFELQVDESAQLRQLTAGDRRVMVSNSDGFAAPRALLPVPQRRALVLMDPAYEVKQDYHAVVEALHEGMDRCAGCTYLVWYPVVPGQGARLRAMLERTAALGGDRCLRMELCVDRESTRGMTTSGVLVINPPWTLAADMAPALAFLARRLAGPGGGRWFIDPAQE